MPRIGQVAWDFRAFVESQIMLLEEFNWKR